MLNMDMFMFLRRKTMRLLLFLFFAVFATSSFTYAATYYTADDGSGTTCSEGSPCTITYCVETKASAEDTIVVKSGTYTETGITLSTNGLQIIGETSGCPDSCDDATTINASTSTVFTVTADDWRISGITFSGDGNGSGFIYINTGGTGRAQDWRIDHCHFKDLLTSSRAISVGASASEADYGADWPGLIDQNRFSGTNQYKAIQHYGGSLTAHGSWDDTLTLGGSDFLFIEDNYFVHTTPTTGVSSIDGDTGARAVIRYNNFTNGWVSFHGVEVNVGNLWRSSHGWEIYENTFNQTNNPDFTINIRGGTGVIYSNTFTGGPTPIRYFYERGDYDAVGRGCFNSDDPCDGDGTYDENQADKYGYICYQQIGATGSDGITSMPAYQWSNTYDGDGTEANLTNITFSETCPYQHVQAARDVIYNGDTAKSGYTAYDYPHPLRGEWTVAITGDTEQTESEFETGGKTWTFTITGAEWDSTLGDADNAATTAFLGSFDSDKAEATGFDAKWSLVDYEDLSCTTTVCTLTLPQITDYDIEASETITVDIDPDCVTDGGEDSVVAEPTLSITYEAPASPPLDPPAGGGSAVGGGGQGSING